MHSYCIPPYKLNLLVCIIRKNNYVNKILCSALCPSPWSPHHRIKGNAT